MLQLVAGRSIAPDEPPDERYLSRVRISLSIYALVIVALLWALAISYVVADHRQTFQTANRELLSYVAGLNLQTEAMISDGLSAATGVAGRLYASDDLLRNDPEVALRALRFGLTSREYVAALFIGTPAGTYIVGRDGYQSFSRDWPVWQRASDVAPGSMLVGEPIEHPQRPGQLFLPIAEPFGDPALHVFAGAWFDIDAIQRRYESLAISNGVIGLIGPNGRAVVRVASGTMKDIVVTEQTRPNAEHDRIRRSTGTRPRVFIGPSAAGDVKMIYAMARPLPAAQMFTMVGRTWQSVVAPWRVRMWTVLVVAVLATGLVLLLTVLLYHHVNEMNIRETRFRQLFKNSLVSILLVKNGRITQANHKASEIFRVPPGQSLIGMQPADLSPEFQPDGTRSREAVKPYYERLQREGNTTFNWTHKRLDTGEPFAANASVSSIGVGDQALTLIITHDVSELEQARRELEIANQTLEERVAARTAEFEQANAHLENVNQELEAFTAAASHDLRSPLTMISGQAGMLELELSSAATASVRERLSRIHTGVRRAVEVIDGMLSLARISRQGIRREEVSLSALVNQAISDLEELDPTRTVTGHIEDCAPVMADSRLMRSLVSNLIGNAWKYSRDKQCTEINFECESGKDGPIFKISDRGAGFDMAHAKELFHPFRRLHSATEFPGTGVGLAIVARVVHRYGGHIWAQSEVGKGATFWFTLPRAQREQNAEPSNRLAS